MKDLLVIQGVSGTFDSKKAHEFVVEYKDKVYIFKECAEGLYYCDMNSVIKSKIEVDNYCGVQTVENNKQKYSKQDIRVAKM